MTNESNDKKRKIKVTLKTVQAIETLRAFNSLLQIPEFKKLINDTLERERETHMKNPLKLRSLLFWHDGLPICVCDPEGLKKYVEELERDASK